MREFGEILELAKRLSVKERQRLIEEFEDLDYSSVRNAFEGSRRRRWLVGALLFWAALLSPHAALAVPDADSPFAQEVDRLTGEVLPKVVSWRRDIHQHPELSNRETRTSRIVADHLRSLGLEVKTMAKTGVVGVLRGRPGKTVALRADMDALPVTEEVDLPFASRERVTYEGQQVGVMHACGHDTHVAILLGTADVLAAMRPQIRGTVKFIFQPAEEGPPPGEEGGARLMIKEGALDAPRPDAIFGLHAWPIPVGTIEYKPGAVMASSDQLKIVVQGRQTHGAQPWRGVDPIVVASQIVLGLQTVVSRQVDLTATPAIVTIGSFHGGVRGNIIPDQVEMSGTIRVLDAEARKDIHARIRRTAESIAQSAGATAAVTILSGPAVTYNEPALTARMSRTLRRIVGEKAMTVGLPKTVAEDFSFYQQQVPGMFFFLGVTPKGTDPAKVFPNHSPRFFADEAALPVGVRLLSNLALDFLAD